MPGRDTVRFGEIVAMEDGEGIPLGRFGMSACSEAIEVGESVMVDVSQRAFDFLNGRDYCKPNRVSTGCWIASLRRIGCLGS